MAVPVALQRPFRNAIPGGFRACSWAVLLVCVINSGWAGEGLLICDDDRGRPLVFDPAVCRTGPDPFAPPRSSAPAALSISPAPEKTAATPGPWFVSQIVIAPGAPDEGGRKMAVINHQRVREGDRIAGGRVREITWNQVRLTHAAGETRVPFQTLTPASGSKGAIVIPLRRGAEGLYRLKARINGNQEIDFIVDSGTGPVLLPADVVSWLQRSGTLEKGDFISGPKPDRSATAGRAARRFTIRSLQIGTIEIVNIPGRVGERIAGGKHPPLEKEPASPRLGLAALNGLGRWWIDPVHDRLLVGR